MKQSVSTKWFSFSEKDFFLGKNMPKKNLEKLIAGIEVVGSLGDRNREIEHIAFDSRKVRQGSLFVAIPGKKYDGKTFLKEAVDKQDVGLLKKILGQVVQGFTSEEEIVDVIYLQKQKID